MRVNMMPVLLIAALASACAADDDQTIADPSNNAFTTRVAHYQAGSDSLDVEVDTRIETVTMRHTNSLGDTVTLKLDGGADEAAELDGFVEGLPDKLQEATQAGQSQNPADLDAMVQSLLFGHVSF